MKNETYEITYYQEDVIIKLYKIYNKRADSAKRSINKTKTFVKLGTIMRLSHRADIRKYIFVSYWLEFLREVNV